MCVCELGRFKRRDDSTSYLLPLFLALSVVRREYDRLWCVDGCSSRTDWVGRLSTAGWTRTLIRSAINRPIRTTSGPEK